MDEPVGTARRARQVFAAELARLDVVIDERGALDALVDEMASQLRISRSYLVKTYLTEGAVVGMARRAAAEATGWDASLHAARLQVATERPETADWPEDVRNYLIDHVSTRSASEQMAAAFLGDGARIDEVGLLRFRYRFGDGFADALGHNGSQGSIPIVTVQHRELVDRPGSVRADPAWGRPRFEWAYDFMCAGYRRRAGVKCDRLVWAWADAATCAAAHRPDVIGLDARDHLAAIADPGTVLVAAWVPVERCLATSHILWDGSVLRGRYLPIDIDDATAFHDRYGSCHLDGDHNSAISRAVIDSWIDRLLGAPSDWRDVRLQVCIDRIDPEEIVDVLDLGYKAIPKPGWMPEPGVGPQRLRS